MRQASQRSSSVDGRRSRRRMRRWSVTIIYLTAAGVMQESSFTVERETAAEAQEACLRLLLRQPGREIVGTEVVEIDAGSD